MLRKITLRCFRQHIDRTFVFTPGLNLLRGANEGGKTTILEAITYALGGAVALPEALDKIVTWDRKESELSVELEIELAGVVYSVTRAKSGATLTSPFLEKKITGQKEVSGFFAELLGGSAKTLGMLLMASQNGLQDVITAGPGEVSQLVQKLGSMDIVDAVIEHGAKELTLGNERVFADRVSGCTDNVERFTKQQVSEEAVTAAAAAVTKTAEELQKATTTVSVLWEPAMEAAASNLNSGISRIDLVRSLEAQHQTVMGECRRLRASMGQAQDTPQPDPLVKVGLAAELERIAINRRRLSVKTRVDSLMAVKRGMEWDAEVPGSGAAEDELHAEIAKAVVAMNIARELALARSANPEIERLQKHRDTVTSTEPHAAEIAALHAALLTGILTKEQDELSALGTELNVELRNLRLTTNTPLSLMGDTCPTCKQKFADADAREAHDAAEKAKAEAALARSAVVQDEIKVAIAKLAEIKERQRVYAADTRSQIRALEEKTVVWKSERTSQIDVAIREIVAEDEAKRAVLLKDFNTASEYLTTLTNVLSSGVAASRMADELAGDPDVSINRDVYPPVLMFWGAIDASERSEAQIKQAIYEFDELQVRYERAQGMMSSLQESFTAQAMQAGELEARIFTESKLLPDINKLRSEYDRVSGELLAARQAREQAQSQYALACNEKSTVEGLRERTANWLQSAKADLANAQKELDDLAFNNESMKAFKLLKPKITEHMWSKSLKLISGYFSDLRDQVVKVTREGSEFLFNGRPATSLSGSGKDILAISIRAALTRTFLPNVGFISLDEPAHGSDEVRTSRILGFLAKSGFQQIILASHDPLSEAVADNIIYVTEA